MNNLINEFNKKVEETGTDSELYLLSQKSKKIVFSNSTFSEISENKNSGFSVRVLQDQKKGFTSSSKENLNETFETASDLAQYSSTTPMKFHNDPNSSIKKNDKYLSKHISVSDDYYLNKGNEIIKAVQEQIKPDNAGVNVTFQLDDENLHIVNSKGLDNEYNGQYLSVSSSIATAIGDNIIEVYSAAAARNKEIDYNKMIENLVSEYKLSKNTVSVTPGLYPVIFSPSSMVWILKALAQGLDGKNIEKKISPLTDKLNEAVLSELFSLKEVPENTELPESIPFDDEGTRTKDHYVIENGILKNYLLNLESAGALDMEPTGNGFKFSLMSGRSYNMTPGTGFGPLFMEPGKVELDDMVSDIKEGVFLRMSFDCWMGNIVTGDLKGSLSQAYRIKDGKIDGRIKNMAFAGNFYKIFGEQLVALSNKSVPALLGPGFLTPHILAKDVSIM
ncbi:TldD/PmbA family protein [bacterium]|nr:TldD/PmbA family protein [bacterium]